jgi:hypothetical protein
VNARMERLFGWSGIASITVIGIGIVLAGFLPPPSPHHGALWVADWFRHHDTRVKWGMIVMMFGGVPLALYLVEITLHVRRIQRSHPALAYVTLGMGAVLVLQFIYLDFFWQVAAFRAGRSPGTIQTLNDMAWIPFVAAIPPMFLIAACFGTAILLDKRPRPAFPRWLGYFQLWVAVGTSTGSFTVFFKTGPLAWNGLVSFWIPVGTYGAWCLVTSIFLVKAVDRVADEPPVAVAAAGNGSVEMEREISALRAELDRLSARVG